MAGSSLKLFLRNKFFGLGSLPLKASYTGASDLVDSKEGK